LKIVAGIRNEIAEQALKASVNFNKISPSINSNFILPSVNASYNFTEKQLLRVAYGKTLNRPEFREWAPIFFYDLDNKAGTYGSLYGNPIAGPNGQVLKIAQIQNYDVRYEWYPSATEMVQVGAFYKSFQDPIQNVMISNAADLAYTFTNAKSAKAYGIEIDIRKNLDVLNKIVATSWWDKLSFIANASFIKSELNFGTTLSNMGIAPNYTTRLQGQSPYTFNTGLYYTNEEKVIRSSLLYNVAGPRISLIGLDRTASMIEMPFSSLDFSIDKTFKKRYILSFGIQNLLNSTMRFIYDTDFNNKYEFKNNGVDKVVREYKPGSYISLGLKVKI
jgi:outer membrane receptor protein involved in Fe transport